MTYVVSQVASCRVRDGAAGAGCTRAFGIGDLTDCRNISVRGKEEFVCLGNMGMCLKFGN